jgi:dTDP-4-dehydrorhamnose 3,5-epimerase
MRIVETTVPGVILVEPLVHRDARGFFLETYHHGRYAAAGIGDVFVQDNHSKSVAGTLRGLHMQVTALQAKLIHVVAGEIFDVAVDARVGSPTFGRWAGVTLSAANHHQLYVPAGFAHGFAVLSEVAEVVYKCSALYDRDDEIAIRYDEPAFAIEWPVASPILSPRDASAPTLDEVRHRLPASSAAR